MSDRHTIHVVLRDGYGRYLAGERNLWSFTEDLSQARVFDFLRDRIAEQLETLHREHGLSLGVVPVDAMERYETCDRCGQRTMPYSIFFDGNRYTCSDCLSKQSAG